MRKLSTKERIDIWVAVAFATVIPIVSVPEITAFYVHMSGSAAIPLYIDLIGSLICGPLSGGIVYYRLTRHPL